VINVLLECGADVDFKDNVNDKKLIFLVVIYGGGCW